MRLATVFVACLTGFTAAAPQITHPGTNGTHGEWAVSEVVAESNQGIVFTTHYSLTLKAGNATAKCFGSSPGPRESTTSKDKLGPLPMTLCDPQTFTFSWLPVGSYNGTHHPNGTHLVSGRAEYAEGKHNSTSGGFVLRLFDTKTSQVALHHIPASQVRPKPGPKREETTLPIELGYQYVGPKTFKVVPKKEGTGKN